MVILLSVATSVSGTLDWRRWLVLGADRPGGANGRPGSDGDEHRAAVGSAGPAPYHRGPAVGGRRLHPVVGSLLLPGGRLADLLGRKVTFPTGLAGLADVWAIGGASVTG